MNKKILVITALIGIILVGGTGFGYYTMKMNANVFRGIQIPIKGLKPEHGEVWEKAFEDALADEELLQAIVDESDYASKVEVPTDEAVSHLKKAIKVKLQRDSALEVGFVGKRKYDDAMISIAEVLYKQAQIMVSSKESSFREYLAMVKRMSEGKASEESE